MTMVVIKRCTEDPKKRTLMDFMEVEEPQKMRTTQVQEAWKTEESSSTCQAQKCKTTHYTWKMKSLMKSGIKVHKCKVARSMDEEKFG